MRGRRGRRAGRRGDLSLACADVTVLVIDMAAMLRGGVGIRGGGASAVSNQENPTTTTITSSVGGGIRTRLRLNWQRREEGGREDGRERREGGEGGRGGGEREGRK